MSNSLGFHIYCWKLIKPQRADVVCLFQDYHGQWQLLLVIWGCSAVKTGGQGENTIAAPLRPGLQNEASLFPPDHRRSAAARHGRWDHFQHWRFCSSASKALVLNMHEVLPPMSLRSQKFICCVCKMIKKDHTYYYIKKHLFDLAIWLCSQRNIWNYLSTHEQQNLYE